MHMDLREVIVEEGKTPRADEERILATHHLETGPGQCVTRLQDIAGSEGRVPIAGPGLPSEFTQTRRVDCPPCQDDLFPMAFSQGNSGQEAMGYAAWLFSWREGSVTGAATVDDCLPTCA